MNTRHAPLLSFSTALFALGLMGCGSSQVHLDPRAVASVDLKVPTQEATFCPGAPLRVELRAALKDGSVCSSSDAGAICMGEKGTVLDPTELRLQGTAGIPGRSGDDLAWLAPRDAMITAENGLFLRGWIESAPQKGKLERSPLGQVALRPIYDCLQESVFTHPTSSIPGQSGVIGPDLKVAATLVSTPFYPEAMLVRIEAATGRTYILATDRSKPVTILSKGQNGADGSRGRSGMNGPDGPVVNTSQFSCQPGRNGMNGTDGQSGGNGGNGGPGGTVKLFIDEAVGDKLLGWIKVGSVGGDAGRGGDGGAGGLGGAGSPHSDTFRGEAGQMCNAPDGKPGKTGMKGPDGMAGRPGAPGPTPTTSTGTRKDLFGDDLPAIEHLEASAKQRRTASAAP